MGRAVEKGWPDGALTIQLGEPCCQLRMHGRASHTLFCHFMRQKARIKTQLASDDEPLMPCHRKSTKGSMLLADDPPPPDARFNTYYHHPCAHWLARYAWALATPLE